MKYRKLRIAWSIAWGLACMLMVVLSVRSRSWMDTATLFSKYSLTSYRGQILYAKPVVIDYEGPPPGPQFSYHGGRFAGISSIAYGNFGLNVLKGGLAIPYWFSITLTTAIGAVPWFSSRFTVRTLLIATTLVAIVLGLIVWLR